MSARFGTSLFKSLVVCCFVGSLSATLVRAEEEKAQFQPADYAFVRSLRATTQSANWKGATSLEARLAAWRSDINMYEPGQNPISARYVVTCYGGVLDLRHFLYTASKVLSAQSDGKYWKGLDRPMEDRYASRPYRNPLARPFRNPEYQIQMALYDTYCVERGREFSLAKQIESAEDMQALIEGKYWQCTPEDLPSSALGAAFACTLMNRRDPLAIDLEAELGKFLAPFVPVADKVREQISHSEAVFGVADSKTEPIPPERLAWFTAEPLVIGALINERAQKAGAGKLCDVVKDGKEGLAKAGYEVAEIAGGLPLMIRPIQK
ncbi:MAG: hypothetical protein RBU25_15585 [Lentisphaeria bacterium]|jgi:hypothetical protein|nr:hypothetical protein [Lentisphaeria bacterium]